MDLINCLKKRAEEAKKASLYATDILAKSPEGRLTVRFKSGHPTYGIKDYRNKTEKYINVQNKQLLAEMQEKEYCIALKKAAEEEYKQIEKVLSILDKTPDLNSVFYNIPDDRRSQIKPYESSEAEEVRKIIEKDRKFWKVAYSGNKKDINSNTNYVTLNGERVRSKSELIIADRLKVAGIPYYYEGHHLLIDEETDAWDVWYPDFHVLNSKTGQLFFWEHFGMMDNPDYCASTLYKLETYAKHGLVMGKNLIVTLESSKHPLNTEYVDKIIKTFLN